MTDHDRSWQIIHKIDTITTSFWTRPLRPGVIPAVFTFGLSIPFCAAVGGGAGELWPCCLWVNLGQWLFRSDELWWIIEVTYIVIICIYLCTICMYDNIYIYIQWYDPYDYHLWRFNMCHIHLPLRWPEVNCWITVEQITTCKRANLILNVDGWCGLKPSHAPFFRSDGHLSQSCIAMKRVATAFACAFAIWSTVRCASTSVSW